MKKDLQKAGYYIVTASTVTINPLTEKLSVSVKPVGGSSGVKLKLKLRRSVVQQEGALGAWRPTLDYQGERKIVSPDDLVQMVHEAFDLVSTMYRRFDVELELPSETSVR